MTERLLQYIWQFRYFNSADLRSNTGQLLEVLHPGTINSNQGPDFLNAKIKMDDTTWAGSVEVHVYASEWISHDHGKDKNYSNVILHVVWKDDIDTILPFPTVELNNRIPNILLDRYDSLMHSSRFIPCQAQVKDVPGLVMISWKERLLAERLEQKASHIHHLLGKNNNHWEEVFWWLLAGNFGQRINSEAFEIIAQSIPLNLLARHKNQLQQLEALLFGQAGLLERKFTEAYPRMLRKEYLFLAKKYNLKKVFVPVYFLRMRPANFPSIRLAQLAMLIQKSQQLFSAIKEIASITELEKLLKVTANDYWHYHYIFDEPSPFKPKTLGREMIHNILVNTIVPILYAYGHYNNIDDLKNKALRWMEALPAEKNSITRGFEAAGLEISSAFDSQALLRLKKEYCDGRFCLSCAIGNSILKTGVEHVIDKVP